MDGVISQQVVKIQRQQGLESQGNRILSELFELRLSIQDNPNAGIHAGDNKITGMGYDFARSEKASE